MNLHLKKGSPLQQKTACLVLGVFEGKFKTPLLKELDQALGGALGRAVRDGEFTGKARETVLFHPGKALPAERVLLAGLGKEKSAGLEYLRQVAGTVIGALQSRRIHSFACNFLSLPVRGGGLGERAQAVAEGLLLGTYRFDRFRTENGKELPPPMKDGVLLVDKQAEVTAARRGLDEARAICRGVCLARDLVNEPGNVKSPEYLAQTARNLADEGGFALRVLERDALEKEGFGGLLGVAQGSVREPRLIVMEYSGGSSEAKPIVLVGKGVVFDAGGISLKPAEKMDEMKMDMAGAAAVLGTFQAVAALKLSINLVGIVPAVENMPSGSAMRPGDILTSLSGRTIEVLNTDAEGRLILADALTWAKRYEPRLVIDLATLTGACVIALGHQATAVLGNHDGLIRQLIRAGENSGERLWQLPLWDEYAAQLKSEVADLKNTGGRPAGTITAAAFLQKFAEDTSWAHLDIAGTAWEEKGRPYVPKGGTGVGVRLLVHYLKTVAGA
ncbi:MAG: leucyl aminopeptidase [Desulfuromonadales bacterium]|nr:leucyl aminopeptidase [Desulfuromonadales bacterium]MDW7757049.1 leucyl aminopeptidase [Desulfuromonadales bacterium]